MHCTTLFALLVGVMIYVGLGALVFSYLEEPEERKAYDGLLETQQAILQNHSCFSEVEFNKLVKRVVSAVEAGLDANSLSHNFSTRWDIASAFFFCGTIITTIGFGNLSPRTWAGQLFCVCYALVGIPMFGILLAGVSDHMGTVLRKAVDKIETLFLKHKVRQTPVRVISAVLSILIGCLIFLAVPTVVFHEVEKWSFVESLYFVVITLTTVGFGDFVPGGRVFKLLVLLWIVFGLAYFGSILTMIGNWLKVLSQKTRAEMEELRAHATDWTQNIQNMSMDFRIPNPLEFNDPFLLQRRKWKRSERRHIRRGAQYTVGYLVRGGSENGHLPNRWAGLSASLMELEGRTSLERAEVSQDRQRVSIAAARPLIQGRSGPQLLARSLSLPAARSVCELHSAQAPEGSLSESDSFGSESESSNSKSLKPCITDSSLNKDVKTALKTLQEKDVSSVTENSTVVTEDGHKYLLEIKTELLSGSPAPLSQDFTPPLHSANAPGCKLLDYFGENLAYIDESSDTLSDRALPAALQKKRRRPRKPRRKMSKIRRLSHEHPPTKHPAPSPDSSHSENQSDTITKL